MNQQIGSSGDNGDGAPTLRDVVIHMTEPRPDVTNIATENRRRRQIDGTTEQHRPNTIDRTTPRIATVERHVIERTHSTLDRGYRGRSRYANTTTTTLSNSNLTAADVANLLRSSIRRGTVRTQQSLRRNFCHEEPTTTATSVENLVEAAAPIGEDSLVLTKDASLVPGKQVDDRHDVNVNDEGGGNGDGDSGSGNDEKKTAVESSISVI